MINSILKLIWKINGTEKILKVQNKIADEISISLKLQKELVKANSFNNAISGCEWIKYKDFALGGWAVDNAFMFTLYKVLLHLKPTNILEFGLGQSSKLVHQYANYNNNVKAITCEHDKDWIDFFNKDKAGGYKIQLLELELEEVFYDNKKTLSYKNIDTFLADQEFDLIIVDAPFGTENYSRSQILSLLNYLKDDFCILIDDSQRKGERETISELELIMSKKGVSYYKTFYEGAKEHYLMCSEHFKFLISL